MSNDERNALLNEIADQMRKLADNIMLFAESPEAEEYARPSVPETPPPSASMLTITDVRAVLGGKVTAEAKALLSRFGANKLSDVDPAEYGRLIEEAEGLTDVT